MAEASAGPPVWGPHNTVRVVDPSPVNWLSITWNTMEEANRVDHDGLGQPSLASGWRWIDDETLEIDIRDGVVFQDGEAFNAAAVKANLDRARTLEGGTLVGALRVIESVEAVEDYKVRINLNSAGGHLPAGHPLAGQVGAAHAAVTGDPVPGERGAPWGSDLRQYAGAGVPTLHYGPGDVRLAHGPDENVPLDQVEATAAVFERLLREGVREPG